mmetsp:Transcript_39243/g.79261  ORF Transcript_39243/g.79261 Transcript_39243/m.79261 type:complete len:181 (-) Transcript_39243:101-643(-)
MFAVAAVLCIAYITALSAHGTPAPEVSTHSSESQSTYPTSIGDEGARRTQSAELFKQITFGTCATWNLHPITGPATCEAAARRLGLGDVTAAITGAPERPEGCYFYRDAELWLGINPQNKGNGVETSRSSPIGPRFPICASEPQRAQWAVSTTSFASHGGVSSVVGAVAWLALGLARGAP